VIDEAAEVELRRVDLRGRAEVELEARREAEAEGQRPFDLQAGPLLRVLLLQLEDEEQVLVVTMHHIVSDGWSMGIFIRELASLYAAYRSGEESPLGELPLQYADFAVWQREWLQGAVLEEQLGYWREQLGGRLAVLELPGDRPRPAVQSYRGANYSFRLSRELSAGLRELSQREGVTLFMTLLAGFQSLLGRYTGQEEIVVGTPIANRTRGRSGRIDRVLREHAGAADGLVGRSELSAVAGASERERRWEPIRTRTCRSSSWWRSYGRSGDLSHTPLFQVMFVLQNTPLQQGAGVAGVEAGGAGGGERDGKVRPDAVDGRRRWRAGSDV
jgi:hypothetical protein